MEDQFGQSNIIQNGVNSITITIPEVIVDGNLSGSYFFCTALQTKGLFFNYAPDVLIYHQTILLEIMRARTYKHE